MTIQFPQALFANNPFNGTALFTNADGSSREISGIFVKANTLSPIGGMVIQNAKPIFNVPTLDVPDANNRCTLEVYEIFRHLLKEDGYALLAEDGKFLCSEGDYTFNISEANPLASGHTELVLSQS